MNSYNSSLTNTYSDRQPKPLSRSEYTAINKENRPISEFVREGQQLRGEIINRTATDVTIRLPGGQTLQARLDVSVPLSIGQMASFEVTHADPALISLRILQDEAAFAQNALIQKALTAAELPVTARNAELVNTLLQHNLPISKESIQSLIRQSNTYPNADVHTLALMTQHNLPITQATLIQFEAYQNYEHRILPQLTNLAQSLSELAASPDPALADLTRLLQAKTLSHSLSQPVASDTLSQNLSQPVASEALSQNLSQPVASEALSQNLSQPVTSEALSQNLSQPVASEALSQNPSQPVASEALSQNLSQPVASDTLSQNLSQPVASEALSQNLSQPVASDTLSQNLSQPVASDTLLQPQVSFAAEMQPTVASPEEFSQPLLARWTLSPKELATSDKVKEFYQQLREDLLELRSALRFAQGKDDAADTALERLLSDTASATGQLQDNLEFMNMLNRIFPYVQLPIRFADKTAHGELYVYTKKEKLRSENGSISVLLHLDMEALGPTDIYLSLAGNQLTSRFYLNDPSLEELFAGQLPELKETLTGKGFNVNFELVARKQEEDPVREFLNNHDDSGLSRFSFDCRA